MICPKGSFQSISLSNKLKNDMDRRLLLIPTGSFVEIIKQGQVNTDVHAPHAQPRYLQMCYPIKSALVDFASPPTTEVSTNESFKR